jgi:hypothetical protein
MSPKIAHYALLAGLASFVPIPILDDWLRRRAHRAMYVTLADELGLPLDTPTLDTLTADRASLLLGCFGLVVVWPIKKLFRTFFYFLTVKDVVDGVAEATLRVAMLSAARHRLPQDAAAVRTVMDATLDKWQYSPISRFLFRGHRPPADWVAGADSTDKSIGWIFEKAGGGPVLADFTRRLDPPAEAP